MSARDTMYAHPDGRRGTQCSANCIEWSDGEHQSFMDLVNDLTEDAERTGFLPFTHKRLGPIMRELVRIAEEQETIAPHHP